MTDENRMLRQCFVEVLQRERAILRGLCVIVLESENPLALGSFLSALSQRLEDFGDGAQIAVYHPEVTEPRFGRMGVRVNETRQDRFSAQIQFAAPEIATAWARDDFSSTVKKFPL